jgi:ATP-dependent Clp protease protease subunit
MKRRINEILAHHTGQEIEKIERDTDRDYILEASAAREYGVVDQVIAKRE